MKTSMNLLLWATHVTEQHFPLLGKLKQTGFDGVEIHRSSTARKFLKRGEAAPELVVFRELKMWRPAYRIGLPLNRVTVM